ncbi:hypothetical protein ACFQ8C_24935 [Streptomyces sp. NPDC056503]|uniref:hypothetical protein n=1 Tax=Streptomyces sp. NPDC056503 TaxID=3345842 RepID=UPI0036BB76EC
MNTPTPGTSRLGTSADEGIGRGLATWDPRILCRCGTEIHDNTEARRLHADNWHSARYPASYRAAVPGEAGAAPA